MNTPDGIVSCECADEIKVSGDKITSTKVYYDPRPLEKYIASPK